MEHAFLSDVFHHSSSDKCFLNIQLLYIIITIKMNNVVLLIELVIVKHLYQHRKVHPSLFFTAGLRMRGAITPLSISLSGVVHN
jgi:hypothetical protein